MADSGESSPSHISYPGESPAPSSNPKEHWRVRLDRHPLPGGLRYEDLPGHPLNKNKRDMMSRPPEKLLRRSPRLEDKNTRRYILYPPYYGNDPPKKLRRPRQNPMIPPDYKEQLRLYELNKPPQPMVFTPEEQKEMWNDLMTTCSKPPSPRRRRDEEDVDGYIGYTKLPLPSPDVSLTPEFPLLAKVNASTLAAIGMKVRKGPDGRMTGYLDS